MKVERRMVVVKDGDRIVGHIRVDRILDRLVISKDIDDEHNSLDAIVRIGDIFYTVPSEGIREDIEGDIANISAVLIDREDMSVKARGSENKRLDEGTFLEYYTHYREEINENSNTYNGVMDINTANIDTNIMDGDMVMDGLDEDEDTSSTDNGANTSDAMPFKDKTDSIYDENTPFYDAIHSQLEDLYARYEREEVLEDAIEGSRFARIYYDEDKYYVIGEMKGDGDNVEIVCYGYPGEVGNNPPEEVNNSYEWLPLDRNNVHGKGYYMMYQNAVTGDIIEN